jgi:hypothetical protein
MNQVDRRWGAGRSALFWAPGLRKLITSGKTPILERLRLDAVEVGENQASGSGCRKTVPKSGRGPPKTLDAPFALRTRRRD